MDSNQIVLIAIGLGFLGVLLIALSKRGRAAHGLGPGDTFALDDTNLRSERLGLAGRPDRIVREDGHLIPEEWKSAKRVSDGHRLQLATYFILIEEVYGERPPHGYVVLGDGSRSRVRNTEGLRAKVLAVADRIREHRRKLSQEVEVRQPLAKCAKCGQRGNCGRTKG